ncbi:hypothetical protein D3C86_1458210 [compost metagenome]
MRWQGFAGHMGVDPLVGVGRITRGERQLAGGQAVQHDAKGIQVAARVQPVAGASGVFGRHIGQALAAGQGVRRQGVGDVPLLCGGQAEARETAPAFRVGEEGRRHDRLVDQPGLMRGAQGLAGTFGQGEQPDNRQGRGRQARQRHRVCVVVHQCHAAPVLHAGARHHRPGRAQLGGEAEFIVEPACRLALGQHRRRVRHQQGAAVLDMMAA